MTTPSSASRVVAAIAALAVGFGITLVGVALDDEPDSSPDVAETSADDSAPTVESVAPGSDLSETSDDSVVTAETTAETDSSDDTVAASSTGITTADTAGSSDVSTTSSPADSETFPCSAAAFEILVDGPTDQDATSVDQTDVFIRAIADRLAALGSTSADVWEEQLGEQFDSFETDNGCPSAIEQGFVDETAGGFFCAAANVSDDERLFQFLSTVVSAPMSECAYERPEGAN